MALGPLFFLPAQAYSKKRIRAQGAGRKTFYPTTKGAGRRTAQVQCSHAGRRAQGTPIQGPWTPYHPQIKVYHGPWTSLLSKNFDLHEHGMPCATRFDEARWKLRWI
jgi:hypothetical protein